MPSRPVLWVDPGFVHHGMIESLLGPQGSAIVTQQIEKIPALTPDWRKAVLVDHVYAQVLIDFLGVNGINSLEQLLAEQRGHLFCSIVKLRPCPDVYGSERVVIRCEHLHRRSQKVEIHLTTKRIVSDTLRSGLSSGGEFGVVARIVKRNDSTLVFHPLLIGFPYLVDAESRDLSWNLYNDYYRLHAEQFEEFSRVASEPLPLTFDEMRSIPESAVKRALGELLRESTPRDWGGETSDFVTSHLHIDKRRISAAFLLKGPARFTPMTLSHLGKNSDQIVRLAHEPAEILVVQHCHDILPQVVETLKVFATQPSRPRRYCLIDGRETLRILKTYGLLERALMGESSAQ